MAWHSRLSNSWSKKELQKSKGAVPGHGDMLQVAYWIGNLAWAEFCIRHAADVNTFYPLSDEFLLTMTARVSSVEIVDLLLQHGASLHGSGTVTAAAGGGNLDTLSFHLGRGAIIHDFPRPDPLWRPRESITRSCDEWRNLKW